MFHVKHDLSLSNLIQFLNNQNILLSSRQVQQLQAYHLELRIYTDRINLISSNDKNHIIERHFLPSFYYLLYLIKNNDLLNKTILDFGTGAGLPGIILAVALPDTKITLLDSSRKKTLFLKNITKKIDLNNVEIICDRIENITKSAFHEVDIIVARAVASIPVLVKRCLPFLNAGCEILTLKGENYNQELKKNLNMIISELIPETAWIEFSDNLDNKRMIKIFNN